MRISHNFYNPFYLNEVVLSGYNYHLPVEMRVLSPSSGFLIPKKAAVLNTILTP